MAGIPPPPPGFTLDTSNGAGVPPPPPGFKLDNPNSANPPPQEKSVSGVKDTSVALSDDPNKEYGTILPFAQDKRTGKTELAFPEIIRAPVAASDRLIQGVRGERPAEMGTDGRLSSQGYSDLLNVGSTAAVPPLVKSAAPGAIGAAKTMIDKPIALGEKAANVLREGGPAALATKIGEAIPNFSTPRDPIATEAAMKSISGQHYADAKAVGGQLTPKFTDKFIDEAIKTGPQSEAGKIVAGDNAVTQLNARLAGLKGKPLDLASAQEVDEEFGNSIDRHYDKINGLDKDGKHIADIQSKFRDMIAKAGPGDIEGGATGFPSLEKARKTWSQAAKMRDIEKLNTRARLSDQPITAFRNGLKTMLANPARLRGYSKEERAALEKAAKTGTADELLRALGSRLVNYAAPVVGASHGVEGSVFAGALGYGASRAARTLGAIRQENKATKIMNLLGQGAPPDSREILERLGQ